MRCLSLVALLMSFLITSCENEKSSTIEIIEISNTTKFACTVTLSFNSNDDVISEVGICYDITNPDITKSVITVNSDSSPTNILIDNLNHSTLYYIRAFAKTDKGIIYSELDSIKTELARKPQLENVIIDSLSANSVYLRSFASSDKDLEIIDKGFCLSKTNNPTKENGSIVYNINPKDSLILYLSDLDPNSTYYVTAYSSNIAGTNYSSPQMFKTYTTNGRWDSLIGSSNAAYRAFAISFGIKSSFYIGLGGRFSPDKSIWEYDLEKRYFKKLKDYPGYVFSSVGGNIGFSINDKGYVVCVNKEFWEYTPETDTWTQKASFPGTGRVGGIALGCNGKGYYGTGDNGNERFSDFYEYDPKLDVWSKIKDYPGGKVNRGSGFSIGNKFYIGLGSAYLYNYRQFWEYDTVLKTWNRIADYPGETELDAVSFSIEDKGYIVTGAYNDFERNNDLYEYNSLYNIWSKKAPFPGMSRIFATGCSVLGKGIVGSGTSGGYPYSDLFIFNPE